jgi:hypothetical protein
MSDDDVFHKLVSYIVNRELQSSRKTKITAEEIQHELNDMDMKSIIRRLVKERKKEVLEENLDLKREKELKVVIKNLKMQVRYYESREYQDSINSEHVELMSNAELGRSFVIADTTLTSEDIDKYLFDTLNVPARVDNDKVTAESRHLLYVLLLYCETCYPKMKLSMKTGYSKKFIRSTTSSNDDLKSCLENLFMMVLDHLPNVEERANKGSICYVIDV